QKRDEAFSAVALTDPEGRIFYLNKEGKELLRIDLERSFSLPFEDAVTLWDPVTATEVKDLIGSATNGNLIQKELSLRRQEKEEMFVLVEAGRLMTMDGTMQGGICILQPL
ncbi:MAG: PAS domain-containing protein, partial [Methanomicrobiales archaeon]|nr:PAS domain-containing protein [Methanomicrobiales archaeon]